MNDSVQRCAECESELPVGMPTGLCPNCALQGVLKSGLGTEPAAPGIETGATLPRSFGNYELLEEIARGGMGVVYRARQKNLGRMVAVKMLLGGSHSGDDLVHRFKKEGVAAARLQHPNIVPIHEIGLHEGQHFLVMDYVAGPSLAHYARTSLPPGRAAELMATITSAIHYAHERKVLHRDLKPSNVILDENGQPHVTDFGLAKGLGTSLSEDGLAEDHPTELLYQQHTVEGQVLGSPAYMPPEQADGRMGAVGPWSDVYSLGAMLYHLLTGVPPFKGKSATDTLHRVLHDDVVPPHRRRATIPLDLETICLKCLEKNPSRRYQTAGELADELGRYMRGEPTQARPISSAERLQRWTLRKPALTGFMVALGVTMLLTAWHAFDWWRGRQLRRDLAVALVRKYDDLEKGLISNIPLSAAELAAATGRRVMLNPNAQRLKVGIYTETEQVMTIEQLAPFLQRVEHSMSLRLSSPVQIELYIYFKRELLEAALLGGLIDIVRIGEGPLVRLRRVDGAITPLVQQVSGGKTGVIFVVVSSPVTNLAGLKGKTLVAGNPTSTSSGYKLLEVLLKAGLHATDLRLEYQDNSEKNSLFVAGGRFDAGVARKDKVTGSLAYRFQILAEFPTTTMPWASRAKLDPAIGHAFISALVGMKDRRILENLPDDATQGFKPADMRFFDELDQQMHAAEEGFFGPGGNSAAPPPR